MLCFQALDNTNINVLFTKTFVTFGSVVVNILKRSTYVFEMFIYVIWDCITVYVCS